YLPRVEAEVPEQVETAKEEFTLEGSETVLVVEDERVVRDFVQRVLEGLGYKVFITPGAEEAEKVFAQHGSKIDLLLTDVIMPGPTGPALYTSLAAKRPSLKVLYISGYTDIAVLRNDILDQGESYLQKPFTPLALGRKIREVLDAQENAR
ncbi:response regulator, partial [Acidobacteria bacterium AH-259-D05]|nr:response regulator [Acidobacteria bacterium AH-259-D05]